ncbi:MAG: transposase family protein [Limnothrix sp.]
MVEIITEVKAQQPPGRPSMLSIEDKVLMTLEYLREYRTYFHIAQSWGVHESTVCRTVSSVEDILIKAEEFHLLGKKQLTYPDACAVKMLVINATEQSIEKPKKSNVATTLGRKDTIA